MAVTDRKASTSHSAEVEQRDPVVCSFQAARSAATWGPGVLFPTIDFAIFLGVVFIGNWLLRPYRRAWALMILAASYLFYSWPDWRYVFLLAASTLCTYAGALLIHREQSDRARRRWLTVTIVCELGMLGWFKYYGFLSLTLDNALRHLGVHSASIPLLESSGFPLGVSFYTFMGLSYVVDVYRRQLEPAPLLDVAVYEAFFPHLLAGPIVRASELLPQVARAVQRDPRHIDLPRAAFLIFGGLFKKVVISSYVSSAIVAPVFNDPSLHSAPEILLAAYGYGVQIYCDFSGYTDIAIGCAMLLGFQFPQNFDRPYSARSLQEFWRRWHITLSLWFRDYLYVPLGGSHGTKARLYRNLMITMVLGGLWHGAGWTFVIWGAIHGVAQCVGHWRRSRRERRGAPTRSDEPAAVWLQRFVTFNIVSFAWIFFNASTVNRAFSLVGRLVTTWGQPAPLVRLPVVAVIVSSLGLQFVPKGWGIRVQETFAQLGTVLKGLVLGLAMLVITTLGPAGVAPFIYFRF
ncbi:MAG: putative poly(beta-D-mannuronate) O-acetylase [Acidimicrobiaceae bacterium]|nr:putative poly(beta-D-mannuronate) O-acetylase [Acidimicrobiaceae bacterium]